MCEYFYNARMEHPLSTYKVAILSFAHLIKQKVIPRNNNEIVEDQTRL